jgi:hypothetical protein
MGIDMGLDAIRGAFGRVQLSLAPVFAGSLDAADISLPRDHDQEICRRPQSARPDRSSGGVVGVPARAKEGG